MIREVKGVEIYCDRELLQTWGVEILYRRDFLYLQYLSHALTQSWVFLFNLTTLLCILDMHQFWARGSNISMDE